MGALSTQILQDSPVAYWPLNESSGNPVKDYSGNARDGNWDLGTRGFGTFIEGTAAATGSGDDLVKGSLIAALAPTDWTLELWFRHTQNNTTLMCGSVARNDNGVESGVVGGLFFNFTTAGTVIAYFIDSTVTGNLTDLVYSGAVYDGVWHHAVFVCPSGTGTKILYVDGVSRATSTRNRQASPGSARLVAASNWTGATGQQYLTGDVAHVALYSGALTVDRVKAHYQAGVRSGVMV